MQNNLESTTCGKCRNARCEQFGSGRLVHDKEIPSAPVTTSKTSNLAEVDATEIIESIFAAMEIVGG